MNIYLVGGGIDYKFLFMRWFKNVKLSMDEIFMKI